jgi:RimJ/RimL family protein N-acetyltransferase
MSAVTYRPATLDDAALASDVMTAAYPPFPQDPVLTRYRWERVRTGYEFARYLAERDGQAIAFLGWIHGPWEKLPERHCEVEVWLDQAQHELGLVSEMWSWIAEQALDEHPGILLAYCGEDEPVMLDSLAALGYTRERAEKVWELDLNAHGSRLRAEAAQAGARLEPSGIQLTTVAAWDCQDKLQRLYEMDSITRQDIPSTMPILTESFDDFERRMNGPDRRLDRTWIAVDGDRPVAMSYLRFPPVRGRVWTGYTASHPDYRGRGLARAVKLQSLAQAVELGVPVVGTDNDAENVAMLHINETLGYVRRPGYVEHHKRVTNTRA